ncbi:MAG TPA: LysM peptidoglycan-binding domain-containing protein [Lacibacter sp.]|nr:LysM peptidoglycan-binding domain-containing protein [Lacibacter sp.]
MIPGKIQKITLKAFKDPAFKKPLEPEGSFTAQVNPESYTVNHVIQITQQQASGTSGSKPQYDKSPPQNMDFEFLLDATGVLSGDGMPAANSKVTGVTAVTSINDAVAALKKVVYDFVSETHEPPYVIVYWGTFLFKCRLTNLSITYKLFKPDGTPIRATAKCSFTEVVEDEQRTAAEGAESSDLTHIRYVKEGETLPFMCYNVYGDELLYLEVAKANQLSNYRDLKPGQELFFPPVEKIKG